MNENSCNVLDIETRKNIDIIVLKKIIMMIMKKIVVIHQIVKKILIK